MAVLEESLNLSVKEALALMQQRILHHTYYFGVQTFKNPLDFWVYQELLCELRPDVIIEIGNYYGGSTLALAHVCDQLNHGQVIGLDIIHSRIPDIVRQHARITLLEGDACVLLEQVERLFPPHANVLVIEDSSHTYDNTLQVLRAYQRLIKPGGYFIVEDSICHHGLDEGPNPGPYEAIETFIRETTDFVIERERENFLLTWNPKGFLKRVR
ncbi:MAG: class I SAM-dependent methyltransferase [Acidobacteria bacterium]|nr:class I SAM-dependent methyltransferase [Acidobacteriota bacterium]MBI3423617.1 class I SAM-dependent methyltransferase [Acidobacteriota bacterium]